MRKVSNVFRRPSVLIETPVSMPRSVGKDLT